MHADINAVKSEFDWTRKYTLELTKVYFKKTIIKSININCSYIMFIYRLNIHETKNLKSDFILL